MIEHEYDHVFFGFSDKEPNPNPEEVEGWKNVDMDWLNKDVKENPNKYTVWFRIALKEVNQHIESRKAV